MIKLYWYNKKPNFGDELSPVICGLLSGQSIEYENDFRSCDLVAIGSILEHIDTSVFRGSIWGAGFISNDSSLVSNLLADVRAVRGKLTAQKLGLAKSVVLGDPGLLACFLAPNVRQTTEVGIVPHFVDSQNKKISWIARNSDNIKLIDIQAGVESVIKEVSDCRFIIASCLHGLILADALGIPNSWVQLSDRVIGGSFKFSDYYSVYGIHEPKPMRLHWWDSARSIKRKVGVCARPNLTSLQRWLKESFPCLKN